VPFEKIEERQLFPTAVSISFQQVNDVFFLFSTSCQSLYYETVNGSSVENVQSSIQSKIKGNVQRHANREIAVLR